MGLHVFSVGVGCSPYSDKPVQIVIGRPECELGVVKTWDLTIPEAEDFLENGRMDRFSEIVMIDPETHECLTQAIRKAIDKAKAVTN